MGGGGGGAWFFFGEEKTLRSRLGDFDDLVGEEGIGGEASTGVTVGRRWRFRESTGMVKITWKVSRGPEELCNKKSACESTIYPPGKNRETHSSNSFLITISFPRVNVPALQAICRFARDISTSVGLEGTGRLGKFAETTRERTRIRTKLRPQRWWKGQTFRKQLAVSRLLERLQVRDGESIVLTTEARQLTQFRK